MSYTSDFPAGDADRAELKRQQAAARQRRRRAARPRIEFYPVAETREILAALRSPYTPWNSISLTLDRIVKEWATQRLPPLSDPVAHRRTGSAEKES